MRNNEKNKKVTESDQKGKNAQRFQKRSKKEQKCNIALWLKKMTKASQEMTKSSRKYKTKLLRKKEANISKKYLLLILHVKTLCWERQWQGWDKTQASQSCSTTCSVSRTAPKPMTTSRHQAHTLNHAFLIYTETHGLCIKTHERNRLQFPKNPDEQMWKW